MFSRLSRDKESLPGLEGMQTTLRLGRYFNTAPLFWMNLQVRYDLEVAEDNLASRIARDVHPIEAAAI